MTGLEGFIAEYDAGAAVGAALALAAGGFAKGVVGFALPLGGMTSISASESHLGM